jgi:uncharacterized phosphosugar-binding protein
MTATTFLSRMLAIGQRIHETQLPAIRAASHIAADSIAAGRMLHLFGAGHSALPVMEAFPRIGSFVGFHPILELPLSFNGQVVGQMGQRQASFLERVEGYAEVILSNYAFSPQDSMLVISHSGINALPVEIAAGARNRGMKTIVVTSIEHTEAQIARHRFGRLRDNADVVIDNCTPNGDALVEVPGLQSRVASGSTIAAMLIIDAMVAEIAALLTQRGHPLHVYPSHNIATDAGAERAMISREEALFAAYRGLQQKV